MTSMTPAAERAVRPSPDAGLVERIMTFDFAAGDLADFGPRLRRENGWSTAFARRAVEEYRKFLVIAATARHPVSPSDVVDQVWHLHLLHTRSYWDDLCANVLPRPLHHAPGTGAAREGEKFERWYANTLASYRRIFGDEPPPDVWPAPGTPLPRYRKVDLDRHVVLPRPGRAGRAAALVLVLALFLLLTGCGHGGARASDLAGGGRFNPFDLPGPQFLMLYLAASAVACAIGFRVRAAARDGGERDEARRPQASRGADLDPYEIAYLNGGPVLAVNAAAARLVALGEIHAHEDDGSLRRVSANPHATFDGHGLERAVFAAVGTRRTPVKDVRARAADALAAVRERLDDDGLLVDPERASAARWTATLVALSVPAAGILKLLIGLERGRPVGFLVAATATMAVLAPALLARGLHRSRRGERVLAHLKEKHARVRVLPASAFGGAGAGDATMALGVALFGLTWLSGAEHRELRKALTPRNGSADGWSSHFGSCGGSSCGGSSCGGGGGCGGGGCGGCGGGGCGGGD